MLGITLSSLCRSNHKRSVYISLVRAWLRYHGMMTASLYVSVLNTNSRRSTSSSDRRLLVDRNLYNINI